MDNCWFCDQPHLVPKEQSGKCANCGVDIDGGLFSPITETQTEEEEMPDVNDLKSNLKNEDLQQGDVITFINAGEIKEIDFSKAQDGSGLKTVLQMLVEIPGGKNKIYTPNATTREVLKNTWGKDTENWVEKKAKATFIKQLAFGDMIEVLVLEPIK